MTGPSKKRQGKLVATRAFAVRWLRRSGLAALSAFVIVGGRPSAEARSTTPPSPVLERIDRIRARMNDSTAPAADALRRIDGPTRLQAWSDWLNWNNWANWSNGWGNWLKY